MPVLSMEEEFALKDKVIDGRSCRDFADNYQCPPNSIIASMITLIMNWLLRRRTVNLPWAAASSPPVSSKSSNLHGIKHGDRIALHQFRLDYRLHRYHQHRRHPRTDQRKIPREELEHVSVQPLRFCVLRSATNVDIPAIGHRETREPAQDGSLLMTIRKGGVVNVYQWYHRQTESGILTHQGLMSHQDHRFRAYYRQSNGRTIQRRLRDNGSDATTPVTLLMFPLFHVRAAMQRC